MVDYEKLKQIRNMGFIKHTGIKTVELREGYAKGEIVLDERHANPIGSTHGGVLFTLVDTVGGAAATSHDSAGNEHRSRQGGSDDGIRKYQLSASGDELQKADRRVTRDQDR